MSVKEIIVFGSDSDLVNMIRGYKGCSMAVVDLSTQPKFNKKSRSTKEPFEVLFKGNVICTSTRYVSIGNNYGTSVNNRLEKEGNENAGEFVAEELPWGKWVEGSKILIEHNGNYYIRLSYLNGNEYKSEYIYHYENGEILNNNELCILRKDFMTLPKEDSGRQGTEETVRVNSVKLSGILRLKFDGKVFVREGYLNEEDSAAIVEAIKVWGDTMSPITKTEIKKSLAA